MPISPRIHNQKGHAAILFAMIIPVLFGVFTLATDGARAVQDKARLEEATEVATLAVAGENADSLTAQRATAKKFLQFYFPSATISDNNIEINKKRCEQSKECQADIKNGKQRFFEYSVQARIQQASWFPGNDAIVGMGDHYNVAGSSVARKYQSEAIDVVFVADYSGSMYDYWDGQRKYLGLKKVVKEVSSQLGKV